MIANPHHDLRRLRPKGLPFYSETCPLAHRVCAEKIGAQREIVEKLGRRAVIRRYFRRQICLSQLAEHERQLLATGIYYVNSGWSEVAAGSERSLNCRDCHSDRRANQDQDTPTLTSPLIDQL